MRRLVLAAAIAAASFSPSLAQLAVSANDGKVKLVNGVVQTVKDGKDSVAIIDLKANPPKLLTEIEIPGSVVGPPSSVAVSPKEDIALITSAEKFDPADGTKRIADDRVTVLDLAGARGSVLDRFKKQTAPPQLKILATLQAGKGAAGVTFNKAGSLALVANRGEGTISIFTVTGKTVTAAGKVDLGNANAGPSGIVFTPDGKQALVTLDGESAHKIAVLSVDGNKVEYTKRDITAGIRPYGIDVTKGGEVAVVANIGRGGGDTDTISIIDMKLTPPRVVNTYSVGQTPEGIKVSPDGNYVAVTVMNGTNKVDTSPFYKANGILQIWARTGTQLSKVAEAPTGKWCQGIAWSSNSKTVLAQCMAEEEIVIFRFAGITGKSLTKAGVIKVKGGPAGIRTAE